MTCLTNDQQGGEGWSDWWAMALTARATDTATQPRGMGTYLIYEDPPATGGGIRPYPYSTDMTINPQTYGDLTEGSLTIPHGIGSVWATTLWEMYWAIVDGVPSLGLAGEGFRQNVSDLTPPLAGNQIALRLVMDGLKMQPCNPSFVEARDAILAADMVSNGGAYQCHIWYAFAKRGVGVNALDGGGGLEVTEDFNLPSACTQGPCVVPPSFAGVRSVVSGTDGLCHLFVEWPTASNNCGSEPVTYDVYRSTDAGFTPGPATLQAANLTATSYTDEEVTPGTRYYYIVRARDQLGNQEQNLVRRQETPEGSLSPGSRFLDDGGDTAGPRLTIAGTPGNTWTLRSSGGAGGPAVYATSPSGNYPNSACMALQSQTIYLGTNPTLSFQTKYDIEPGWDGAIVEVATASGGFANWTKLDTITYPGVMAGQLGDPACANPGLRDGQRVFNGTSGGQYVPFSGSLAAYANQPVRIRFVFTSDGATNDLGWLLDDLEIDDVQEPGTCAAILAAGDVADSLTIERKAGGDIALSWG
ncbi:MAG: M36 family metallopeptidase, partial [Gemmatimonadales bacterium]